MQAEMQEGILHACIHSVVARRLALRVFQQRLVLGMRKDNVYRDRFQSDQRPASAMLFPSLEKELADLIARGRKHFSASSTAAGARFAVLRRAPAAASCA